MQRSSARIRIEKRTSPPLTPEAVSAPQYPAVHDADLLSNGWSMPASTRPDYPFQVERTQNKPRDAIGFLPVYSKIR